jgi:hypothetical protein
MMVVRQPSRFGVVELDNKDSKKVKTKYNIWEIYANDGNSISDRNGSFFLQQNLHRLKS